ncbi:MAG TPA: polysaccharide biosynthesis protein [Candidatus Faecimonas intestinavium]|nr:polysaccharide biosynthesis protein [Candidatus Faecimonas intestinavium]
MEKKKKNGIRKSSFIKGAFIATLGIVLTKILGIIYVIPFHAVIGERGGALYGYAYTIYLLFMSLSSAGIPLAISKIVSEYQTLGYYNAKRRAFIIGKKIALLLGFICFLLLLLFAPWIAHAVLGDLSGGNTISDVTLVIRVVASALLVVPVLSIYRGYFEGHRFMEDPSFSQVLEQLVRVFVIVLGSFLALKVFDLSITTAVGIAVFGATAGAISAYLYLIYKKKKNNSKFNEKIRPVNEPIITNKQIFKKIVIYAVPFILIDVFKSLYNYIDMVTVVEGLVQYANFSVTDVETIMSMLSTWGAKFNMIVLSISTGIIISLIPNLTTSVVKKDYDDINHKINQAFSILLFFTLPMTLGISFLADSIWTVFYGTSEYGPSVLSYFIFVGFMIGLFTSTVSIIQVLKDYKTVIWSLVIGVVLKFLLNDNLIMAFYKMGLPAYYGVITASLIGYFVSFMICIMRLKFKYKINYENLTKNLIDTICGSMLMIVGLFLVNLILPSTDSRIIHLVYIVIYVAVGALIYIVYMWNTKSMKRIFGNRLNYWIKKKK